MARSEQICRGWRAPVLAVALLSAWAGAWPAVSAAADLEAERRAFEVPDGFEVNCFASEADGVVCPIAIRWDPRGRLFVACTVVYPQIEPGDSPNDWIQVLEDTDGDGRADRSQRFAEGLNIPTGMELGDGGVYLGQGTEILFLKDHDGDGVAGFDERERRVFLGGFGNGDSHQTVNSFVWGPGGQLFFCQGDGIESRVETPWGVATLFKAGVWRLRPKRLQLHGLLDDQMGPGNPWGVAFDAWGQGVVIDGAGGISFLTPALVPTKHFQRLGRIGKPGGYCGVEVLSGRHLPPAVRGDFVLGDYKRNRVGRFALRPEGSGFKVDWKPPLLHSSHRNFRPIDVRMGPDGAVYVADWYNPVICHQDDFYRHPDRDKIHGRIWRVTAVDRPRVEPPRLAGAPLVELAAALRSPEGWTRYQAKRELTSRPRAEAGAALRRWADALDPAAPGDALALAEAVGALATVEVVDADLLGRLLASPDHRARAFAARVLGRWADRLPWAASSKLLVRAAADPHPLVRLEAVVACAGSPDPRAIEIAASVVDREVDGPIDYALTQITHHLEPVWLPGYLGGGITFEGDVNRIAAVLKRVRSPHLIGMMRELAAAPDVAPPARAALLGGVVAAGGPEELRTVFEPSTYGEGRDYNGALHATVLAEFAALHARSGAVPGGDLAPPLKWLLKRPEAVLRERAAELAGAWGVAGVRGELIALAGGRGEDPDIAVGRAAIAALGRIGGDDARRALERLARSDGGAPPAGLTVDALVALCRIDLAPAAERAADLLASRRQEDGIAGATMARLVGAFLDRQGGAEALAAALAEVDLAAGTAERGLQAMHRAGRWDPPLVAVFNRAVGITGQPPEYRPELARELGKEALVQGDPARGEQVFRSRLTGCYACHAVGGAGGLSGPDLTALGTAMEPARIAEEVLWPARHVKEGYSLLQVTTRDGGVRQGYARGVRGGDLVLQDLLTGRPVRVPESEIAHRREAGSAMPPGLTAALTRAQLLDLLGFLSALGTPGEYSAGDAPVIREWEVWGGAGNGAVLPGADDVGEAFYSRVSGDVAVADLRQVAGDESAWLRTRWEVETPAVRRLRVNDPSGLRAWLDGRPLPLPAPVSAAAGATEQPVVITLDPGEGRHRLDLRVDLGRRGATPLHLEWIDLAPGDVGP